jgi:hypothetical protein
MKYIISERHYRLLVEQSITDDWLYNWFKNVPEEKITKTFPYINSDILSRLSPYQNNVGGIKPFSFSKTDLLKLISQRPPVQIIDTKTFNNINKNFSSEGILLAVYIDKDTKTKVPKKLDEFNEVLRIHQNPNLYGEHILSKEEIQKLKDTMSLLETVKRYAGKILIPSDFKTRNKNSGIGPKDITRHEEMHFLYDMVDDKPEGLIKKLCPNPTCRSKSLNYNTEPTEIYSYLMTLRSKLNMQPIDVVKSTKITKGPKQTEISIVVNRNGKEVTLRDYLPNFSSVLKTLECCTGDLGNSIKVLHNNLAMNDGSKKII